MRKFLYITPILLSLLVCSCVSISQISIDNLEPAKVSFPKDIKTVAIVNNTITDKETKVTEERGELNQLISTKSTFQGNAKLTTEAFAENVAKANFFDEVIICDSVLRERDLLPRESELSQNEVKKLTTDLGVDMLFSVENVTIKTDQRTYFLDNIFRSTIDATVAPMIKVYLPSRTKPLFTVYPEDKIYWDGYGLSPTIAERNLITKDSLIKEASAFAGELPTKVILPRWEKVNRFYYTSGCLELRDGGALVREGSWDEALKLWQTAHEKKSKKIKMRTAFNIALYYELQDKIEQAIEWAKKADQLIREKENKKENIGEEKSTRLNSNDSLDYIIITRYLLTLKERMNAIQTLNLQMERFNGNF
ncbi:hypothetical protein SAMN05444405_10724 [Bacteroides luti]|jgi:tetratricopeptide (TPR) repeat protein|uniref:Tetratricopeptide repeat-containing protein n=1 Tax=Bacteroides luti TaxID=1297750 RepID=A0A1M5AKN4_9BACE|nr:DUF6340 family protein [Bacteroides luti]SHF30838.1 hypothetical protein SAMN05444405_10724 [Bacteroides luti]|eukprot:TRINITY_DN16396_c0_g1_i1.p1 TRINITY_DN16396_c0_g1~~TRINITY_DN16396_c0_g1_i1.p1  ORF type:complete len:365 (-),score=25.40 TRINITY_DN16396_c0_g1_i1:554-1648(-)